MRTGPQPTRCFSVRWVVVVGRIRRWPMVLRLRRVLFISVGGFLLGHGKPRSIGDVRRHVGAGPAQSLNGSIRAFQAPHRELNLAAGQFSPSLDLRHVGCGRPAIEERPRRLTGLIPRLPEGLTGEAIISPGLPAPGGHSIGEVSGASGHCGIPNADPSLLILALCVNSDFKQGIGKLVCHFQLPGLARFEVSVHVLKNLPRHHRGFFPCACRAILLRRGRYVSSRLKR
jgi:hypothetical protein